MTKAKSFLEAMQIVNTSKIKMQSAFENTDKEDSSRFKVEINFMSAEIFSLNSTLQAKESESRYF